MIRFIKLLIPYAFILLISCENDPNTVKKITQKVHFPVLTIHDVNFYYSDSAVIKVKLQAPLAEIYENEAPYKEFRKGVKATFYTPSGETKSTLVSNYAIARDREKTMEAKSNVVVVNEKGEQLNTEHLVWDQNTEKIYSKEFVKITTKDKVIFGEGFEANQDFSTYKIFKIKGTINLQKPNDAAGT